MHSYISARARACVCLSECVRVYFLNDCVFFVFIADVVTCYRFSSQYPHAHNFSFSSIWLSNKKSSIVSTMLSKRQIHALTKS